jgi:hypothetical protein
MGKASSAKKVARAARAGGSKKNKRKPASFPLVIGLVVILGVGLVAYAKNSSNVGDGGGVPPQSSKKDHWHAAYGLYICDYFSTPLNDEGEDKNGIHTHADNLIHVHPFTQAVSGTNATMGVFFDQTGLQVSGERIKLPDGRVFKEGETTCDGKPAEVRVAHWKDARTASASEKPDDVKESGFGGIQFTEDLGAYTIAFVPKGTDIPAPPEAQAICEKAVLDAGGQPAGECGTGATGGEIPPGAIPPGEMPGTEVPTDGSTPTDSSVPADGSAPPASDPAAPADPNAAPPTTAPASG